MTTANRLAEILGVPVSLIYTAKSACRASGGYPGEDTLIWRTITDTTGREQNRQVIDFDPLQEEAIKNTLTRMGRNPKARNSFLKQLR